MPEHLIVVGGGYIGLELGSVWARLGAKVTVLEFLPRLLPLNDAEVAGLLHKSLAKQGLEFHLETKVTAATQTRTARSRSRRKAEARRWSSRATRSWSRSAAGRSPRGWGWRKPGVKVDDKTGKVVVDAKFQTNVPGVLCHRRPDRRADARPQGQEEGIAFAEILAGKAGHVNYDAIPSVIYTGPELASVGLTEEQVKETGRAYKVGKFPFAAKRPGQVPWTRPRAWSRSSPTPRPTASGRPHPRPAGLGPDRRGGAGHGVFRCRRGHRPHLPRPPDAVGSRQGSGLGGVCQGDSFMRAENTLIGVGQGVRFEWWKSERATSGASGAVACGSPLNNIEGEGPWCACWWRRPLLRWVVSPLRRSRMSRGGVLREEDPPRPGRALLRVPLARGQEAQGRACSWTRDGHAARAATAGRPSCPGRPSKSLLIQARRATKTSCACRPRGSCPTRSSPTSSAGSRRARPTRAGRDPRSRRAARLPHHRGGPRVTGRFKPVADTAPPAGEGRRAGAGRTSTASSWHASKSKGCRPAAAPTGTPCSAASRST